MRIQTEGHFVDYQIRDLDSHTFEITKWEGGRRPAEVYRVDQYPKEFKCNCHAGAHGRECKHVKMIKDYLDKGKPETFPNLVAALPGDLF